MENNLENFKKDLFEITQLYENGFEEVENVEQIKITLAQAELSLLQTKKTGKPTQFIKINTRNKPRR